MAPQRGACSLSLMEKEALSGKHVLSLITKRRHFYKVKNHDLSLVSHIYAM
jgi:hypothetical protein